ncbi:hypothetical protein FQN60_013211 [Etheostoma spectabile]|uniref:Uncharacterized protein n=1 Tax=Etheostoma spectabile TaxID=54343 RepID=A0A5J5DB28_9PERO|nr:hypothetical protein FQN60_013211 [Etheostoma spectabile]
MAQETRNGGTSTLNNNNGVNNSKKKLLIALDIFCLLLGESMNTFRLRDLKLGMPLQSSRESDGEAGHVADQAIAEQERVGNGKVVSVGGVVPVVGCDVFVYVMAAGRGEVRALKKVHMMCAEVSRLFKEQMRARSTRKGGMELSEVQEIIIIQTEGSGFKDSAARLLSQGRLPSQVPAVGQSGGMEKRREGEGENGKLRDWRERKRDTKQKTHHQSLARPYVGPPAPGPGLALHPVCAGVCLSDRPICCPLPTTGEKRDSPLALTSLPFLIIETSTIKPYQRGFYCSDESIRFPRKEGDTISDAVLCGVGILIAIFSVSRPSHLPLFATLTSISSHFFSTVTLVQKIILTNIAPKSKKHFAKRVSGAESPSPQSAICVRADTCMPMTIAIFYKLLVRSQTPHSYPCTLTPCPLCPAHYSG